MESICFVCVVIDLDCSDTFLKAFFPNRYEWTLNISYEDISPNAMNIVKSNG